VSELAKARIASKGACIASKGVITRSILKDVRDMSRSMRMGVTDHLKIKNNKYEY
jgi:hypothetical protein